MTQFPTEPYQGGDDPAISPTSNQRGILGHERGTQVTRRLETDANRNLYVTLGGANSVSLVGITPLAVGAVTGLIDGTLTTIATFTAAADKLITKVSVSGTVYAKFQLFLNTVLIDTVRTGPDRSSQFCFEPLPLSLAASDILDVKVTHYNVGQTENFEATVYGG